MLASITLARTEKFSEASTPEEADLRAIASDWGVIGNDIRIATEDVAGVALR